MTLTIKPVTSSLIGDVAQLFSSDKVADDCWCMWFIIPVKEFHAVGHAGNRASFCELVANSREPLGLLAYQNDQAVGWCAVGPASRYVRALKTPTYGTNRNQETGVWLVPCLFIRKDTRRAGVSRALLEAAVQLAQENGATAIDGFPHSSAKKHSSGDPQVGSESLFSACGFEVIRTLSTSRVVMRRELKA